MKLPMSTRLSSPLPLREGTGEGWQPDGHSFCGLVLQPDFAPGHFWGVLCDRRHSQQHLTAHAFNADGGHRVLGGDDAGNPGDIVDRLRCRDDGRPSAWPGRRGVELAIGKPQQPGPDVLVRHAAGIGFGDSHGRRQGASLSLGFVAIDEVERMRREQNRARWPPVCTRAVRPGFRHAMENATPNACPRVVRGDDLPLHLRGIM